MLQDFCNLLYFQVRDVKVCTPDGYKLLQLPEYHPSFQKTLTMEI